MNQNINELITSIKNSKKYKSLSNTIVKRELEEHLKANPKKSDKEIIKEVRKKLHRIYSSYQTGKKKKRDKYLIQLDNGEDVCDELLSITLSTKERKNDYASIYKKIFSITKKPKTIIDLGCGLNPLSIPLMNLTKLKYYAYDIDEEDINFLNKYFDIIKKYGIKGKASIIDLINPNLIKELPKSDLVFLFKIIDLIDNTKKGTSEQLIKELIKRTKFIITSFPTRTLTRKNMNLPKRRGFELMLERINLKFKSFSTDNEVFYVINSKQNLGLP